MLHLEETESTNTYALNLLSKNKPSEGTVVSTLNQTAGRGQVGSNWFSEPGKNIAISVILYPVFLPVRDQFLLNQAISLAVFGFVSRFIPSGVKIKWPNDILVNEKKIAGILIQNTLTNTAFQSSIAGIGINVNQILFREDIPNPTSLKIETGKESDINLLIGLLCEDIEKQYLRLRSGRYALPQQEYLENLYRFGQPSMYQRTDTQKVFQGRITGLEPSGKLIVEQGGLPRSYSLKEIKFL